MLWNSGFRLSNSRLMNRVVFRVGSMQTWQTSHSCWRCAQRCFMNSEYSDYITECIIILQFPTMRFDFLGIFTMGKQIWPRATLYRLKSRVFDQWLHLVVVFTMKPWDVWSVIMRKSTKWCKTEYRSKWNYIYIFFLRTS